MKNQTRHIYEVGNVLHQDIDRIEGVCLFIPDQREGHHTPGLSRFSFSPGPGTLPDAGQDTRRLGSRSVPLRARAPCSSGAPSPLV